MSQDKKQVEPASTPSFTVSRTLMAAALALPGLAIGTSAHAENAPERPIVAFKYSTYQDSQPSADRIKVETPAFYLIAPITETIGFDGSVVYDSVSGASPLFYNTLSGASIIETRKAADAKLTKYFSRASVGVGASISTEHDYLSRGISADARFSSEDNNTTYALGMGYSSDRIHPTGKTYQSGPLIGLPIQEKKHVSDFLVGVTKVLTPNDLLQTNLTYSTGHGFYTDPYKSQDNRPDNRSQFAWLVRWNHHFDFSDSALRLTYRYYYDSWKIRGGTLEAQWVVPLGYGWQVVPGLRYYSQNAADFYRDPAPGGVPPTIAPGQFFTADQRSSAFGAFTPGIKVIKMFGDGWSLDFKAEYYEQRSSWRLGGNGSPGLEPFKAQLYQVGVSKKL